MNTITMTSPATAARMPARIESAPSDGPTVRSSLNLIDAGKAPEHIRNFLRLAQAGVYDGTDFHRVVRGFVAQAGALNTRSAPLTDRQQKLVHPLQPEFTDTKHVRGILSMARGDDPASATTSFFIVLADAPSLDGKYTVFGHVVDGMDTLTKIESGPVNGESPVTRIDILHVRVLQ